MRDEGKSRAGVADVHKWFFFMATDVIGELSFGSSFAMLEKGKVDGYIRDLQTVAKVGGVRATFPWTMKVAAFLPLGVFKEVVESTDRILNYANESVERYKRLLASGQAKNTLFTRLFESLGGEGEGEEGLSDREIRNDAQSFIVAGSDTTANTLTYLVWAVLRDKRIQERLVAELASQLGEEEEISDTSLRELPYLNQVIAESLRLYPAVPSGLPRVVPEKGAVLAGQYIPGGMTVTTQLHSLHRDAEVFINPEEFNPERWEQPSKEMKDAYMPFGAGSRSIPAPFRLSLFC